MRLVLPPVALATTLLIPAVADASPFAIPLTASDLNFLTHEPPADTSAPTMGDEAAPADADPADPADTAEAEPEVPTGDEEAIEPEEGEDAEGEEGEDDDLEDELEGPVKKGDFNANAIGIRGGIHLVPSYFLNAALASYGNSLCRDEVGNWGEKNGLVKVDGCNFYVAGDYTRRVSRAFDVMVGVGYLHIKPPDSLWIDNEEWDRDNCSVDEGGFSACNLGAADYTEIDLRMVTIEVNFVGRGTLFRNADVEVQMGGGGGVGVGILVGQGVRRTPLGPYPGNPDDPGDAQNDVRGGCQTLEDLADFTKCTPRYYDDKNIDQDDDGNPAMELETWDVDANGGMAPQGNISTGTSFADCSRDKCKGSDLAAFGATETGGTWPAYPLVNILGSFRVIVKDTFGIGIEGGVKNGFFFGGNIQYFFGGGGNDKN